MKRPLYDRVIVKPIAEEESKGDGLYLPGEKAFRGEAIAVGIGRFGATGREPMEVKTGDIVVYGKNAGVEIEVDGSECLIMRENEILFIE